MLTLITLVTTNKPAFGYKFFMLRSLVLVIVAVSLQCERTSPRSVILNLVLLQALFQQGAIGKTASGMLLSQNTVVS